MKTTTTLLMMTLISLSSLFAQAPEYGTPSKLGNVESNYFTDGNRGSDTTTIDAAYGRNSGEQLTFYTFGSDAPKYITGTNPSYNEVGQRFGLTVGTDETVRVWGAIVLSAIGNTGDGSDISLNVYDLDADNDTTPSNHTAAATTTLNTDVMTGTDYFFFDTAQEVNGSFVASISGFMGIDDTIALLTNQAGDGSDEALMYDPNVADAPWFKISYAFTGLVHDIMIFPIIITDTEEGTSTEIKELELNTRVFPNPATDNLHLISAAQLVSEYSVRITNLLGQTVYNNIFNGTVLNENINISDLNNGSYIVNITTENGSSITKHIVVE